MEAIFREITSNKLEKNVLTIVLFLLGILLACFLIDFRRVIFLSFWQMVIQYLVVFFILVLAHEGVHYCCHRIIGHIPSSKVKFGLHLDPFTPYVLCEATTNVSSYRINDLMPGILTGVLPLVLGISLNNLSLIVGASTCLAGASSDWIIFCKLLRYSGSLTVEDHQDKAGCRVYI